jgi:hypothetical protein
MLLIMAFVATIYSCIGLSSFLNSIFLPFSSIISLDTPLLWLAPESYDVALCLICLSPTTSAEILRSLPSSFFLIPAFSCYCFYSVLPTLASFMIFIVVHGLSIDYCCMCLETSAGFFNISLGARDL